MFDIRILFFPIVNMSLAFFFFFNDTAPTEIYTLSYTTLFRSHIAEWRKSADAIVKRAQYAKKVGAKTISVNRSEEHTSELQSHVNIVCRLLLEKKKSLSSSAV